MLLQTVLFAHFFSHSCSVLAPLRRVVEVVPLCSVLLCSGLAPLRRVVEVVPLCSVLLCSGLAPLGCVVEVVLLCSERQTLWETGLLPGTEFCCALCCGGPVSAPCVGSAWRATAFFWDLDPAEMAARLGKIVVSSLGSFDFSLPQDPPAPKHHRHPLVCFFFCLVFFFDRQFVVVCFYASAVYVDKEIYVLIVIYCCFYVKLRHRTSCFQD